MRRTWHCLSLLLLATLAAESSQGRLRSRSGRARQDFLDQQFYLPAIGASPLRFRAETPAPDPSLQHPPLIPPALPDSATPDFTPPESQVPEAGAPETHGNGTAASEAKANAADSEASPAKAAPSPILRDELRPRIKSDDFLPFFQVPGSAERQGDVILAVPAPAIPPSPAPLPASSATYRQTPK